MTWYDNSWNYRKTITISNAGSALTNYQVPIIIDTSTLVSAGKMRSDCGDIRLTDTDGSTTINHWIESGCNSLSTKIWVKIPSIPSNGTTDIYLYYGNTGATHSNSTGGTNTFVQYHEVASAEFHDNNILTIPFVYEARARISPTGGNVTFGVCDIVDSVNPGAYRSSLNIQSSSQGYLYANAVKSDSRTYSYMHPSCWALGTYYDIKIVATSSSNVDYYMCDKTTKNFSITTNIPIVNTGLNLFVYQHDGDQIYSFIRKYASPEPTISAPGTEEILTPANITATDITVTPSGTPCIAGICTITVVVTWSNSGGSDGTVIPNITIDTMPQTAHAPRTVIAGSYIDETFIVSGLSVGTHSICPDPN